MLGDLCFLFFGVYVCLYMCVCVCVILVVITCVLSPLADVVGRWMLNGCTDDFHRIQRSVSKCRRFFLSSSLSFCNLLFVSILGRGS